jgi:hypothetical protein
MNNKLAITALLMLAATTASAQKLSITKETIDIGRTGYEVPVTATFELKNKGSRKLIIQDVNPDCNCTRVEFPKGEIGSGDKFTIRMTYDARMLGHFNKQAAIISNASEKPVYITMKGVVLAELKDYSGNYPYDFNLLLSNANNMEFDNVKKGEQRTFEMGVMNNGYTVMQPNILHLPPYLSAKAFPEKLEPGHSGKIVFTLNSEKIRDFGLTQTNVYLAQQLGEKVKSATEIGVSAVLLPPVKQRENAPQLVLSDTTLVLDFNGKAKKSGEIVVANSGKSQLDITSLQMFTRGLKVTLGKTRLAPNETTKLKITGVAEDLKKARSAPRVLMITNDPQQAKVVITINSKL